MDILPFIFGTSSKTIRRHITVLVHAASGSNIHDKTELLLYFAESRNISSEEFNEIVHTVEQNANSNVIVQTLSARARKKLLFDLIKVSLIGKHLSNEALNVIVHIGKVMGYADHVMEELIIPLKSRRMFDGENKKTLDMLYYIIDKQ